MMRWSWGGGQDDKDPTKSLDPGLKEFLDSHQPRPYVPAEAQPAPPPSPPTSRPVAVTTKTPTQSPSAPNQATNSREGDDDPSSASTPKVFKESLFQDGRYAHLWSTYTPQESLNTNSTTPLERVVSANKDRRDFLQRAALENCAFEHELQQTCFTSGSAAQRAKARMTMCREESKAFNRCYSLQGKFLQALGYMSRSDSTEEEDERVQMHADRLYHRMMDHEAAVADAERNHTPIPPLSSVFNTSRPAPDLKQMLTDQPTAVRESLTGSKIPQLDELPPHEREVAVRAALQEAKLTHLYTEEIKDYAVDMEKKRMERQQAMSKALGEPIGKFIIPDGAGPGSKPAT